MPEASATGALKPRIIELPALEFTGVERNYQELQSESNGFCTLWTKHFPERQPAILPGSTERTGYGVYRMSIKAHELPHPESFGAAMKTDGKGEVPEGCTRYRLAAATYAFFEQAPGYLCEIGDKLTAGLVASGFGVSENAVCFETDATQVSGQEVSVNIWIPVVR